MLTIVLQIYILKVGISNFPKRRITMITALRDKNQITLPSKIVKETKLKKNSSLKIEVNSKGQIVITPVVLVEQFYINDLKDALDDVKNGNISKAMSANEIIKKLDL